MKPYIYICIVNKFFITHISTDSYLKSINTIVGNLKCREIFMSDPPKYEKLLNKAFDCGVTGGEMLL